MRTKSGGKIAPDFVGTRYISFIFRSCLIRSSRNFISYDLTSLKYANIFFIDWFYFSSQIKSSVLRTKICLLLSRDEISHFKERLVSEITTPSNKNTTKV